MTRQVKNWNKFQHFKDRRPPWIKLYRDLLDDPDWHELDGDDAKGLVMIWLIASEDAGVLPDARKLAFRLRTTETKAEQLLNRLSHWLGQDDITPISEEHHSDTPETEGETQEETELDISIKSDWPKDFRERFWSAYPRRVGRKAAIRKLEAVRKSGEVSFDRLLAAIGKIEATEEKFIPHPTTWLNEGRYLDAAPTSPVATGPPRPPIPGMRTDEEIRADVERRKTETTSTESTSVLPQVLRVPGEEPERSCGHFSEHAGVRRMGEILRTPRMETFCNQSDGEEGYQSDDDASPLARVV